VVTEFERELPDIGTLPAQAFTPGDKAVPATAMAHMVAALGQRDPKFVVTNADGNEASNMKPSTRRCRSAIRRPTRCTTSTRPARSTSR
jgi:phosphoketolase